MLSVYHPTFFPAFGTFGIFLCFPLALGNAKGEVRCSLLLMSRKQVMHVASKTFIVRIIHQMYQSKKDRI